MITISDRIMIQVQPSFVQRPSYVVEIYFKMPGKKNLDKPYLNQDIHAELLISTI